MIAIPDLRRSFRTDRSESRGDAYGTCRAACAGMGSLFRDRKAAGKKLGRELMRYAGRDDVIVLALPRGGVPVGCEVARALGVPLDVFVVRKLGMPFHEELAMGAIASGGARLLNDEVIEMYAISDDEIDRVIESERRELERRERLYRGNREFPHLAKRTVILVDDGLATGSTMRAAVMALRQEGPERIVVAVPVGAADTCDAFRDVCDDIICLETPEPFAAVGLWYDDFEQTTDEEVHELLAHCRVPNRDAGTTTRRADAAVRR
jgi:putative phosphoribosyl transferase